MSMSAFHSDRLTEPTRFEWRMTFVLGIASLALGLVVLLNPFASAHTLALLVGLGLLANGLLELTEARQAHSRLALLSGAVLLTFGIVALVWPQVTLWAIALLVGLAILGAGILRALFGIAQRANHKPWVWPCIKGGLGIVLGIIAISWPKATVLTLALIFGIQIASLGVMAIAGALEERRMLHDVT